MTLKKRNFQSLLTYLLTPWSRVLLEKLTGFQLVQKFSAFHGTRRFIPAFTSANFQNLPHPLHCTLSYVQVKGNSIFFRYKHRTEAQMKHR